jgi:hypothetical protein
MMLHPTQELEPPANPVRFTSVNGKKPYGLGQASLKLLAGDDAMIAGVYCRAALQRNISADLLRSDSLEHLEKLELI